MYAYFLCPTLFIKECENPIIKPNADVSNIGFLSESSTLLDPIMTEEETTLHGHGQGHGHGHGHAHQNQKRDEVDDDQTPANIVLHTDSD